MDVVGAQDVEGGKVCGYEANEGLNQRWRLEQVAQGATARLVRIVSCMKSERLLTVENGQQMRRAAGRKGIEGGWRGEGAEN